MPAGPHARAAAVLLACAGLLVAPGCGERSEPVGPASELYPLTITTADRSLTLSRPARRIVLLDDAAEPTLDALGAGDRVVASIPLDGRGINAADLRSLRPDLVVAASTIEDRTLSQAASVGAQVYVTPDTSIREVERAITQLGLMVAEPAAGRRRVRAIEQRRALVERAVGAQARPSVFVDLGDFTSASDRSLVGDLVREARGRNVAGDTPAGLPLTVRQLLAADPGVYVSAGGATLPELRKHRRLRKLHAVRSGRVVSVDPRLLAPGPGIGAGLEALARALHPDAFR